MFDKLRLRLTNKFPVGEHQLCYLYDEIMKHFNVDGIEGEEVARCVMCHLHEDNFFEVRPQLLTADMFYMLGD